jgi:hypothetical protein
MAEELKKGSKKWVETGQAYITFLRAIP